MSALAEILYKSGKKVGGYDREESEYTARLAGAGIPVWYGLDCRIDDYEVIVYTDALQENNPLIMRARRLNKTLISRGKLLYEISRTFKKTVAVAGCHGKTTCTAMLAHIFAAAGAAFSAHIGGNDSKFNNAYLNGYDYFVTVACEYMKNFLYLKP